MRRRNRAKARAAVPSCPPQQGYLYNAYRDHIAAATSEKAADHMERLHRYASVYESFDQMPAGCREGEFFERLRAVEMTTAHPFLLELVYRHGTNKQGVQQILADIESFVVRRMACRMTTKPYNRLFIDSIRILDQPGETIASAFRAHLAVSEADTQRWPTDAEFRRAWLEDPLGKALPRARVEMLILALEARASSGKTEKVTFDGKLTIEHLMPQKWRKHWPLPASDDEDEAEASRNRMVQTVGNLTLLTNELNPSISNGPWDKKRDAIQEHSILKLNLRLKEAGSWDEAAIRRRGEELFILAQSIWPRPT